MPNQNAAIIPYAYVTPPTQYSAGEEIKERQRIRRGLRPIGSRTVTDDDTLSAADDTVLANKATPIALTLPSADGSRNLQVNVLNIGVGVLTVVGTVNATVNPTLNQFEGMTIMCNGVGFYRIGSTS